MDRGRRKALGRGLEALIPGSQPPHAGLGAPSGALPEVSLSALSANPHQPRREASERELDDLVSSIRQNGVLQPVLVRRNDAGFEVIAGERRLRAARRAGLEKIPVIVKEATEQEALELALIENVQRENLNPIDQAAAYRRLTDEFGLTQEAVAQRMGKSRTAIANTLRLLALPEGVQVEIRAGRLSEGHARALAGVANRGAQLEAAKEVVRRRLSVRDTEVLARRLAKRADVESAALEDRLRRALGTKVSVLSRANGAGKIVIEYYSLEELDGLVRRLVPAEGAQEAQQ